VLQGRSCRVGPAARRHPERQDLNFQASNHFSRTWYDAACRKSSRALQAVNLDLSWGECIRSLINVKLRRIAPHFASPAGGTAGRSSAKCWSRRAYCPGRGNVSAIGPAAKAMRRSFVERIEADDMRL
jgi:hypothetical protein